MKNFRQCMIATAIVAALPFSVLAQSATKNPATGSNGKGGNAQWKNQMVNGGGTLDGVQAFPSFILDSLPNAYSFFTNNQQPLQYDPVTGTLALIKRGNPLQSGNNIYIRKSMDLGKTWTDAIGPLNINNTADGNTRYPSLLIVNPGENTTNPDDLLFAFSAPLVVGTSFGPVLSGFLAGTDATTDVNTGVDVNGETYTWGTDSKLAASKDGNTILTVGVLTPPAGTTDFTKNNYIGLRTIKDFGTFTATVPPQWAAGNFIAPSGASAATSSQREIVGFQRDPAGNFHLAVQGRFVGADSGNVLPGVSSSTDNGTTWSAFDRLPVSVIRAYATANQMNPDSSFFSYTASDFAVTGTNQFSFVMSMFENDVRILKDQSGLDSIDQYTKTAHLVEVYKSSGTWNIRKIANTSGLSLAYLPDATTTPNQMGNEIQISRTADGRTLLAKWVEFYNYVSTNGQDTTNGTDVTFAVRNLDSANWSRATNVTQTELFDKVTWIPNIVPNDLKNIPILSLQTILDGTEATFADVQLKQRDPAVAQHVVITGVDPVFTFGPEGPTGINEEFANGLRLGSVAPNPANGAARFGYTLSAEGQVSIEVVNVMGQKVLTLDKGFKTAGEHTVTFNAAELPDGTYYYTLKHNGGSITRMLTIVH
ncbi:MAG: T9SS type A sorting domain-containing protein [Bacteroidota bacterium]